MKIGEVAARAGVAPRLIRYYEQQGLLTARRDPNGYRRYDEADCERVQRIAELVQAGLSTRLVKLLLDTEDARAREQPTCPLEVAEQLARELVVLEKRIDCLSRSRDVVRGFLEQTRSEVLTAEATTV